MKDINSKLTEIKALIETKVLHPYLLQYIEAPAIDEDKLLLLVSSMESLDLSDVEQSNYGLTTMLVQIALDTHEHVTNSHPVSNLKERQLTVLAGDYYSGLYYKFLADSDDIPMIRELSRGIKEINEHKILLYQKDFTSVDCLFNSIKKVESSLLTRFAAYFGSEKWTGVIENFLLLKHLLREKETFSRIGFSHLYDAMETALVSGNKDGIYTNYPESLADELDSHLLLLQKKLEGSIQELPKLNGILKKRVSELACLASGPKICVEEG